MTDEGWTYPVSEYHELQDLSKKDIPMVTMDDISDFAYESGRNPY
ncbi:hypothetical protein [Algoriphagus alkaliphilus]|nr:hypothetical protein [Algoriphagus alkaliphilus]